VATEAMREEECGEVHVGEGEEGKEEGRTKWARMAGMYVRVVTTVSHHSHRHLMLSSGGGERDGHPPPCRCTGFCNIILQSYLATIQLSLSMASIPPTAVGALDSRGLPAVQLMSLAIYARLEYALPASDVQPVDL
jgi:hypothetical protein